MNRSELSDVLKASYMPQKQAAAYLKERQGYSYDPQLSSMQQKVFLNREGKPVIAQRGLKRLPDWSIEDAAGYLGYTNTSRVNQSKELTKATKDKYGIDPTVTGHSLGGYLAEKELRKDQMFIHIINLQVFHQFSQVFLKHNMIIERH